MAHYTQFLAALESQAGDPYVFGAEVNLNDPDPPAFDCSEFVEWASHQIDLEPRMPDGSWYQARHCAANDTLISVPGATATPGALLFRFSSSPFTGGRPSSAHVAVSRGDGTTIEARGSAWGVGSWQANDRGWTHAALVPGLDYTDPVPQFDPPSSYARPAWEKADLAGVISEWSNPHAKVSKQDLMVFFDRLSLLG